MATERFAPDGPGSGPAAAVPQGTRVYAIGEAVEPGVDVFEDEKAATQPVDGQLAPSVEGEETRKRLIPFAPGAQDAVRLPRPELPRQGHGFAAIRRVCPVPWSRPDGPYLDEPEARG